ncbi:PCYCGC motif-containing (lipo)protein [Paenibacillus sp. YYML68]|uniref:PCYCGC motif-containing (lipo)protein n=1 Tax=Paenibacillus sp. YYML68 TaxID=2909250 RepID=UPI002492F19C|nr:PCYCGC motif-containing (lipo)protein [Paenibacillus sp. YYML68]
MSLAAVVGCSSTGSSGNHAGHMEHKNGDLQEKTASVTTLPTFLDGQSEHIRLVYQAAGQSTELLGWIPCYCGCGDSAGHQSNANCFVREIEQDGSVVWDDHGTRCGVCLTIAVEAIKLKQDGHTEREIRAQIDQKYKQGFAKPTPTPMPS